MWSEYHKKTRAWPGIGTDKARYGTNVHVGKHPKPVQQHDNRATFRSIQQVVDAALRKRDKLPRLEPCALDVCQHKNQQTVRRRQVTTCAGKT